MLGIRFRTSDHDQSPRERRELRNGGVPYKRSGSPAYKVYITIPRQRPGITATRRNLAQDPGRSLLVKEPRLAAGIIGPHPPVDSAHFLEDVVQPFTAVQRDM